MRRIARTAFRSPLDFPLREWWRIYSARFLLIVWWGAFALFVEVGVLVILAGLAILWEALT